MRTHSDKILVSKSITFRFSVTTVSAFRGSEVRWCFLFKFFVSICFPFKLKSCCFPNYIIFPFELSKVSLVVFKVLILFVAFFVTVTIAGCKYETASQQHDPTDWLVPSNGRRCHCMISFEIALPGNFHNHRNVLRQHRFARARRAIPATGPI